MAGVYIAYPFCAQKCTFCNFASGLFPRAMAERYLAALEAELAGHRWQWRPETLYLGGGSPGLLDPNSLDALLSHVPGRPWLEATIEAPPGCITPERAARWAAAGLNRVSLGVQSFVAAEAARTGRRHTAQTVAAEVAILRGEELGNFNIDLIAGLPGQTPASWRESLEWAARLEAPHVSVYMLEVDEDSRLGREILEGGRRYGAAQTPTGEAAAGLYEEAVDYLERTGLRRYEISNFARPGFESRHNLKYWRLEPYAGFGAGAHSFDGAVRSGNAELPDEYVSRYEKGQPATVSRVPARPEEEKFFVGMRLLEGVEPTAEEWARFGAAIRRLAEAGLVETGGGRLRLTGRGVLLSNEVFQEFIEL
jgi:oxygen-independent coproporphyrinogen-3 oxidase